MHGGQDQVARLRGFDRDVGSLEIADFADHDDVRILPQEGAKRDRERHPRLVVDVDLVDARQRNFRRVFGRRNVDAGLVENLQHRVQRHRLAATRRAGNENHPVRPADRVHQQCLLVGVVAQVLDADQRSAGIENTHHDLFAEQCRQCRDPEVDRPVLRQHQLQASILRHAFLGDVELRDDLDARGHLVLDHQRWLRNLDERAVETVADPVVLFERLEVNVGCAGGDRIEQDLLDVADDRRVVDFGAVVLDSRRCRQLVEVDLQIFGRHQRRQRGVARFDDLGDGDR